MADFSFSDMFGDVIDWIKANPQLAGAAGAGIATLLDPAQATTTTSQYKTNLPDYIAPYVGRMLNQAESLAQEDYIPYAGQRLADFNADQQAAFDRFRNMQAMTPQQTQGAGIVGQAANQLLGIGGQQVNPMSPYQTYAAEGLKKVGDKLYDAGNARWDQAAADHYMSPYMQSVVDIQKREAQRDYDKQLPVLDAAAVRGGAFGGSRHGLIEAEAQRNLNQRLGDIQSQGLQSAYTNAQGQFNADMARQGQTLQGVGSLATGLAGIGQQGVQNQLAGLGVQGSLLGAGMSGGQTLANIGQQGFQNQLAANTGLLGVGNQQQALEQKSWDTGYQDFMNQRQHPYQQLQYQQSFLQGLPMTQYATANTTPAPTLGQQLVSSGIGAYSALGR
jgi:hypothetical protein